MQDRVPLKPNRMLITPENGAAPYYATVTRADEPTQEGTPLNKASLLKDATALLYGLGADAVPDDVLAFVGKYAQHWWIATAVKFMEVQTPSSNTGKICSYNGSRVVQYSTEISIDEITGDITLVSPTSLSVSYSSYREHQSTLQGKYITNLYENSNAIAYMYPDGELNRTTNSGLYIQSNSFSWVTAEKEKYGDSYYVQDSDKNAYPENGIQDFAFYEYIGIPFDNAVWPMVKIATGSYTGTGTYGASNPNSLTFEFVPKIVFLSDIHGLESIRSNTVGWFHGSTQGTVQNDSNANGVYISWSGTSVSWYTTTSDAAYQLNQTNIQYGYIAIG